MGSANRESFDNVVVEWIDSRLPIFTILNKEYGVFPTPRNFNYFWNFVWQMARNNNCYFGFRNSNFLSKNTPG